MDADVSGRTFGRHGIPGRGLRGEPVAAVAKARQHVGLAAVRHPRRSTRLVTRVHADYDWSHPAQALLGVTLMEFGDFAMMRRMLLGIKARAEALARPGARGEPS